MNIAFALLVLVGIIALWFFLAFLFKPLGGFLYRIFDDTKSIMNETEKEKKDNHGN